MAHSPGNGLSAGMHAMGFVVFVGIFVSLVWLAASCDLADQARCLHRGGKIEWTGAGHHQYGGCKLPR